MKCFKPLQCYQQVLGSRWIVQTLLATSWRKTCYPLAPSMALDSRGYYVYLNQDMLYHTEKTFTEKTIPAMYTSLRDNCVRPLVSSANSFVLTTDCWTSQAGKAFIGITVHFTEDFQLKSFALTNEELPVSHNAANLASTLEGVLEEWGLSHKNLSCVTTDNAANIENAICDILVWPHLGCFGHTLNLAVKAGLKIGQVKDAIARCSHLVTYFHKFTRASYVLGEKQPALGLPSHVLIQEVETRWNSTLDMIERVLEQQSAVCATLIDQKRLDLMPQDSEFKIVEKIAKVINRITNPAFGEEYVTVSALKPLFHYLVIKLKEDPSDDNVSARITTVRSTRAGTGSSIADVTRKAHTAILDDLSSRYQSSLVTMLLCSASFMDPRFKSLPFISTDYRAEVHGNIKQQAIALTNSKSNTEASDKQVAGTDSASGSGSSCKKHKHHDETWSIILGPMFSEESKGKRDSNTSAIDAQDSQEQAVDKEFQKYLAEDLISIDDNPLKWWKNNQFRFPILAKVAKQFLCIPATSVPCERLFSTSGKIIRPK